MSLPNLPREFIEQIKAKNPLIEVASEMMQLEQCGTLFSAKCIHGDDKSKSLMFYPDKNSFYCFGCGAGSREVTGQSDVIAFVKWVKNISWEDSVLFLAKRAGLEVAATESREFKVKVAILKNVKDQTVSFHEAMLKSPSYLEYYSKRGIDLDDVKKWQLGLTPDNRVAYPIFDKFNVPSAFSFRRDPLVEDPNQIKYKNQSSTSVYRKTEHLYGLNNAIPLIKDKKYIAIVEGYNDVIVLQKYGIPAVSPMGSSISDEQIKLLKSYTMNILLFLDGDNAGQIWIHRNAVKLVNDGFTVKVVIVIGKDPDDIANQYKEGMAKWIRDNSSLYGQFFVSEVMQKYNAVVSAAKLNAASKIEALMKDCHFSETEMAIYKKQLQDIL